MHLRLSFGKNRDFTRPGTSRAPPAPRRTRPGEVRAGLTRLRPDTVPLSAGKDALCSSVSTQKSGLSLQNLPLVPPTPSRGEGRARCALSRQEPRSCSPLFWGPAEDVALRQPLLGRISARFHTAEPPLPAPGSRGSTRRSGDAQRLPARAPSPLAPRRRSAPGMSQPRDPSSPLSPQG